MYGSRHSSASSTPIAPIGPKNLVLQYHEALRDLLAAEGNEHWLNFDVAFLSDLATNHARLVPIMAQRRTDVLAQQARNFTADDWAQILAMKSSFFNPANND